jgi:hypothetical protein
MLVQDVEHDPRIGHTCDLNAAQIIINAEPLLEGALQCFDARSSRMNQRSVDIEKQEALLCLCHGEKNEEVRMTNDEGMTKIK